MDEAELILKEWETFCVIVGGAAAALMGLMFVVIVLGADREAFGDPKTVRSFSTPNVLHFCAVLLLAVLLSVPHQSWTSLAWCIAPVGLGGLGVTLWGLRGARSQREYEPVLEDWIWFVTLPLVAYAALLVAFYVLWTKHPWALHVVGGTTVLLLFIGIHNAWDTAMFLAVDRGKQRKAE